MKVRLISFTILIGLAVCFSSFTKVPNKAVYDKTNNEQFIVVLDAGHGGKDPGKHSQFGFNEKDIALNIALEVGKRLEEIPNIKVVYTRKTDVFVELKDRAKIANKADADLFVSIHCNAHHSEAYGTETYVLGAANSRRNLQVAKAENEVILLEDDYEKHYQGFDPNSPESWIGAAITQEEYTDQSIVLATLIEDNFVRLKRKSRGVKQASLWVIHQTAMPSVLIEAGFVTHKNEGYYLNSKKGQQEISKAIFNAILEYKETLDSNVSNLLFADTIEEITTAEEEQKKVTTSNKDITFKVQIAASSKSVAAKPYNFNGLDAISKMKSGSLYKYFYGETSSYDRILELHQEAKNKGYSNSFIVAFKENKKIALSEALKTITN